MSAFNRLYPQPSKHKRPAQDVPPQPASSSTPQYDELTAIEYSTLRVPYETLNRKFRHVQKQLERNSFRFSKEIETTIKRPFRDERVLNTADIKPALSAAISSLETATASAKSSIQEELDIIRNMKKRIKFLQAGARLTGEQRHVWNMRRTDRMVAEQLLRFGYIDSGKKLIEKSKIGFLVDVEPYESASVVIKALLRRNMAPLHEWIAEHKSRLKRVVSSLEMSMWMQEAVECVRNGERKAALVIMRKHVAASGAESADDATNKKFNDTFKRVMGLIAVGRDTNIVEFRALLDDERWNDLVSMFREDFANLYQLPEHSAFSVCLQVGVAAHKTPSCTKHGNSERAQNREAEEAVARAERQRLRDCGANVEEPEEDDDDEKRKKEGCPACDPITFEIGDGLPFAHVSNSRILCAHTRALCNEDNLPYQLPSGYVYGQKALGDLRRDGDQYLCPRTNNLYPCSSAVKLYIL